MGKNNVRAIGGVLCLIMLQTVGCGYFMYPVRRGQTGGRVDPGVIVMDGTPGSVTYGTTCTGGPPLSVAGTWPKAAVAIRSDRAAVPTAKAMPLAVGDLACCGSAVGVARYSVVGRFCMGPSQSGEVRSVVYLLANGHGVMGPAAHWPPSRKLVTSQ